ncbi:RICIN domain-containing protein [Streptomyces sp. NBC_01387]|uniref:RICIN domain-containing protein n=1 Tax=unclassified Streptomyces TaxID=2593676 RepID=UPI00224C908C|nr:MULTISPECIES: RICIN domain-containing protein [unclassified Streptomyces]MCX4549391.1 RICIN domain-containing protein [Streptomyces sp. NBC_01500]WSC20928.1 RICIN domain-containing protein [Streptomyces sp. NBC_01766]WSV54936.1 RICIN domain-containing protein [Streptomyces sp. NBC_01014]
MSLWTSLEPPSTTVDPGGSASVRLRVRNTGDVVDEYRFVPVGDLSPWTTVEPQTIRLYPGTTGSVQLTFAPPRTPDATAGPTPYGVQIIPTEHPQATTVPEGNVTVTPFTEVRAELVPHTVKGRFRGRPRLAIDNIGNVKLTASVNGTDNSDQLSYDIHPANVQIEPGRAAFLKTTLKPRQIIWAGAKQSRPYNLAIQRSGAEPLPVQGTYIQPGLLPRWLGVIISMLIALTIALVMVWIAYKPSVASQATERSDVGKSTLAPPPPAPSAPAPPDPEPSKTADDNAGKNSGGGGGGAKKPPPDDPLKSVMLRNGTTHLCAAPALANGSAGSPLGQYKCGDDPAGANQVWSLETVFKGQGPNNSDLVQIRNNTTGYCVDLPDKGAQSHGQHLYEGACTRTLDDNQLWYLVKRPNTGGLYWIRNYISNGLCMDVSGYANTGDDMKEGDTLGLFTCSDDDDQIWYLTKPDQN